MKMSRHLRSVSCPVKLLVGSSTQKDIDARAKVMMYDDYGKDFYQLNRSDRIFNFEVYIFSSETKFDHRTVAHSAIKFFTVGEKREINGYLFEWGKLSDADVIRKNKGVKFLEYLGQSWFGKEIESKYDVDKLGITLFDIYRNAAAWILFFGKGGSYPRNCRGYVDFALRNLFCQQMNWQFQTLEPIIKCIPQATGNSSKWIELK